MKNSICFFTILLLIFVLNSQGICKNFSMEHPLKLKVLFVHTDLVDKRINMVNDAMKYSKIWSDVKPFHSKDAKDRIYKVVKGANKAYKMNKLPIQIEIVGVKKLKFQEPKNWDNGVWQFLFGDSRDKEMKRIHYEYSRKTKKGKKADIVILWWGYWGANPGASVDRKRNSGIRISLYFMNTQALMHEIGHLFGCMHKYGWSNAGKGPGWQTTVSECKAGGPEVLMFSNPHGHYLGLPLGDIKQPHRNNRKIMYKGIQDFQNFPFMKSNYPWAE